MDNVVLCNDVASCRPLLEQFLVDNNLDRSLVHPTIFPYRVTLSDEELAWFIPKSFFNLWSRNREYQIVYRQ